MTETSELRPFCPLTRQDCNPLCMLLLTSADEYTVSGRTDYGEGQCSFAVLASHVASEKHVGGNYLMKLIDYDYTGF